MKKIVAIGVALFISCIAHAVNQGVVITKENVARFQCHTNWSLFKAGDQYTINNVSGKQLRLDIYTDQYLKGTSIQSDVVYVKCGDKLILTYPGMGLVCDLPYPGTAAVYSYPFVSGATGNFSIF